MNSPQTNEYKQLHKWVRETSDIPLECQSCEQIKPLDAANISQEYQWDLKDWEWLCRSCHMRKDGRLLRLQEAHAEKIKPTFCEYGHPAVTKTRLCMKMYNCSRRHSSCEACQ